MPIGYSTGNSSARSVAFSVHNEIYLWVAYKLSSDELQKHESGGASIHTDMASYFNTQPRHLLSSDGTRSNNANGHYKLVVFTQHPQNLCRVLSQYFFTQYSHNSLQRAIVCPISTQCVDTLFSVLVEFRTELYSACHDA